MIGTTSAAGPQPAPETSAQAAAHRRIARAYDPRTKLAFFSMKSQRLRELMDFKRYQFGDTLPDDDWGRDCLQQILNQLALMGADPDTLRARGRDLLPEIDDDDSLDIMVKEIGTGRRIKAEPLGRAIGLNYQTRVALDIRTIGCFDVSPAQRKAIANQKRAADRRWNREKAGAVPQAKSAEKAKPWEAEGISRSSYYAARKKPVAKPVQSGPTEAVGLKWPDYDVVVCIEPADSPAGAARVVPEKAAGPGTSQTNTDPVEEPEEVCRGEDDARAEPISGIDEDFGVQAHRPEPIADTARAEPLSAAEFTALVDEAMTIAAERNSRVGGRYPTTRSAVASVVKANLADLTERLRAGLPVGGGLLNALDAEYLARCAYRARREKFDLDQRSKRAEVDRLTLDRRGARCLDAKPLELRHQVISDQMKREQEREDRRRQKAASELHDAAIARERHRKQDERKKRDRIAASPVLQRRHAGLVEAVRCGDLPASVLEGRAA